MITTAEAATLTRLSQRERTVLTWVGLASLPMTLEWGFGGALAAASIASWLMPGFLAARVRGPTGDWRHDAKKLFIDTWYSYPIWLWLAINGKWLQASISLPLALCLTSCYIIAWYGKWPSLRTDEARYAMVALSWAVALSFAL